MKTLILKILICCIPLFFMGANQPRELMTHKQATQFMERHEMDALDTKIQMLESAIVVEYSEIRYLMTLKKTTN